MSEDRGSPHATPTRPSAHAPMRQRAHALKKVAAEISSSSLGGRTLGPARRLAAPPPSKGSHRYSLVKASCSQRGSALRARPRCPACASLMPRRNEAPKRIAPPFKPIYGNRSPNAPKVFHRLFLQTLPFEPCPQLRFDPEPCHVPSPAYLRNRAIAQKKSEVAIRVLRLPTSLVRLVSS